MKNYSVRQTSDGEIIGSDDDPVEACAIAYSASARKPGDSFGVILNSSGDMVGMFMRAVMIPTNI